MAAALPRSIAAPDGTDELKRSGTTRRFSSVLSVLFGLFSSLFAISGDFSLIDYELDELFIHFLLAEITGFEHAVDAEVVDFT